MIVYFLRRLLLTLVTLCFLSFVSFSLSYLTPQSTLSRASLINAYVFYFNGLLHLDFGVSSTNGQSVIEQLKDTFPATVELSVFCIYIVLSFWDAHWDSKSFLAEKIG